MDHHCWWTNNCVAYNTIRPFFLFCIYLILLTCVGVPTIIFNLCTKNREYDEGILGVYDFMATVLHPQAMITFQEGYRIKILDIWLFYGSMLFGLMAVSMACGILYSVMKNTNQIEALKQLESKKRGEKISKLRPIRTFRQALSFIFGQENLTPKCLLPL